MRAKPFERYLFIWRQDCFYLVYVDNYVSARLESLYLAGYYFTLLVNILFIDFLTFCISQSL